MSTGLPVGCTELAGWAVASCCAKGIRGSMEDVSVTRDVLAILDGHGGRECAEFIAPQLGKLATLAQDQWTQVFTDLDDAFRARGQPSGSTCVLAALTSDFAQVAHIGDSRAVLFRAGSVLAHTIDHKPGSTSERERIARCGGKVQDSESGPSRIAGIAVSRAFGTFVAPMGRQVLKDPDKPHAERLVSCVPELASWPTQAGDILVLACDGIWDVLSEADVAEVVCSKPDVAEVVCSKPAGDSAHRDVAQSARMICEKALKTSTDNVSCIVAEFGGSVPESKQETAETSTESKTDQTLSCPGFNRATPEEQLEIGKILEYGETLIEMMNGLDTDSILDGLWLGQVGDACYLPFLNHAGVTRIVNCAAEIERPELEGVQFFWLKWYDSEEQGKSEAKGGFRRLQQATRYINEGLEAGEVVLVHCVQGVSRSASVVVAFLMEYRQMPMEDAVALVRAKHTVALKPFRFQEMLRAFRHSLVDRQAR